MGESSVSSTKVSTIVCRNKGGHLKLQYALNASLQPKIGLVVGLFNFFVSASVVVLASCLGLSLDTRVEDSEELYSRMSYIH